MSAALSSPRLTRDVVAVSDEAMAVGHAAPAGAVALLTASTASLAVAMYLGASARIAANSNLPAPATSQATSVLRLAALLAAVAGLWILGGYKVRLRHGYLSAVVLLALVVVVAQKLMWSGVSWTSFKAMGTSTVVLLLVPRAWKRASDTQIAVALAPLVILCAFSVFTYATHHKYLFPWYDRWGLVGCVVGASAVVLTDADKRVRLAFGVVAVLSIVLSTSRQGVLASLLVAAAALAQSRGVRGRIRTLLFAGLTVAIIYSAVSASTRVSTVGGISGDNGRRQLWGSAWSVISHSPLFGLAGDKPNSDLATSLNAVGLGWSDSVHNFVLDSWIRGGLAAAVLSVVLMGILVWPREGRGRVVGLALLPFFLLGSQLLYFGDPSAALLIAAAYGMGIAERPRLGLGTNIVSTALLDHRRQ